MKLQPRLRALAGLAFSMCTPAFLLADVTPAMDRVPANTPVIATIKSMTKFHSTIDGVAKSLKLPMEQLGGLGKASDMLKMEGLNPEGSFAIAMLSLDNQKYAEQPPLVVVLPVKDYSAFSKGVGGKGEGLEEVKFEGETTYIKDLGGGFAAMGPIKEIVEKFEGKAGNSKGHEAMMGATGKAVYEANDAFVLADMKDLGPIIKEKVEQMKEQVAQVAAGANPAGINMIAGLMDGVVRDASCGVMGLKAADAGVSMDFGANFKEGSEYAGYFNSKGKAASLIGNLPKLEQGFLLVLGFDTSNPGLKSALKKIVEKSKADPEAGKLLAGLNPLESIDKVDGMAFCMGQTPALMGGLFLNTTMFVKSSDPAGYLKTVKDAMAGLNGKTLNGMTYTTAYEAGGAKAGDKPVDAWSVKFKMDENNPAAAQIGQAQMMLFGPGGMGGYAATTDNGAVLTYSKNSDLMGKALESAKSGNGLTSDEGLKDVQTHLPADRVFECQVGVKSILETVTGVMAMMGSAANFDVPAELPPIGIGATGTSGGFRMTMFLPTKVLQTFKALGDSVNGAGGQ